ncbi:MAG: hypothetical protein FWF45_04855 [Coriobacteriia bacterium]|nr:hypothetical protein [Coriobacteriia bacterium]
MPDKKSPVPQEEIPAAPEAVASSAPEAEAVPLQAAVPATPPMPPIPPAAPAAFPPTPQPQVVYLKRPFYKQVWFWIAAGLAVVCFCFMIGGIGILVIRGGEGRMGRSGMMQNGDNMRMQGGCDMQYYDNGRSGRTPGNSGSLESTSSPAPKKQQRIQKNGNGSGRSSGVFVN